MKRYFHLFFAFLRAHQKGILIVVFSFLLGVVSCFLYLGSVVSGILSKDWQLHSSYGLLIDADALAAINREDYAKVQKILERDLVSRLEFVYARAKLREPDSEIDDKILAKAFAAFGKIDKAKLINERTFASEEEKKSFISNLDSIDAFFSAKGFAAPAVKD